MHLQHQKLKEQLWSHPQKALQKLAEKKKKQWKLFFFPFFFFNPFLSMFNTGSLMHWSSTDTYRFILKAVGEVLTSNYELNHSKTTEK